MGPKVILMAGVFFLAAGPSRAAAQGSEQPVELDLMLEGVSIAHPAPSCGGDTRGVPLLCQPDPFKKMCDSIPERIRADIRRVALRADWYDRWGAKLYDHYRDEAVRKFGYPENHKGDKKWSYRFVNYIKKKSEKELTRGSRAKVEANVALARRFFIKTIKRSRLLTSSEQKAMIKTLQKCTRHPGLKVPQLQSRNAYFGNQVFPKLAGDKIREYDGRKVNPIVEGFSSCHLTLTGRMWADCEEGSMRCFQVLFHEFGHSVQSCNFYRMWEMSKLGYKISSSDPLDPFYDSKLQIFSAARTHSLRIAKAQELASSCARELAPENPPLKAVVNNCSPSFRRVSRHIRERCSIGAVSGYPSQWNETEADLWGASALGEFLKSRYSDSARARSAFIESVSGWCSGAAAKSRKQRTGSRVTAELESLIGKPKEEKPQACVASGAHTGSKPAPFRNSHGSWKLRINRYMLRNLDLRRALGCSATQGGLIPVSCSPTGLTVRPYVK